jgi:hypothetical protein
VKRGCSVPLHEDDRYFAGSVIRKSVRAVVVYGGSRIAGLAQPVIQFRAQALLSVTVRRAAGDVLHLRRIACQVVQFLSRTFRRREAEERLDS